jgi:nicotinamidase-related amidase
MSVESSTLLLVCDLQPGILGSIPDQADEIVAKNVEAIAKAKANGHKVGFVRVAFRQGHPEVHCRNQLFSGVKQGNVLVEGTAIADLHPEIQQLITDEPIFTKRRVGPFDSTDLDHYLRAQDIDHVVVTGVATGMVVMSAVRGLFDRDYHITVLSDCCADANPKRHQAMLEHVFPHEASVMTLKDWAGLESKVGA